MLCSSRSSSRTPSPRCRAASCRPNPNTNLNPNPYPDQVPRFLQPPLTAAHAEAPFGCTTAVRARLTQLVKRGFELGAELWRALQAPRHAALSAPNPQDQSLTLKT